MTSGAIHSMAPVADYDPTDLQAQERAMEERDKQARQALRLLSDDVNRLMSSKSGRRFVLHLLAETNTFGSCFDTNALHMAFKNGERNVGLKLQALIQGSCPDRYFEMLQEHLKNEQRRDAGPNDQ